MWETILWTAMLVLGILIVIEINRRWRKKGGDPFD